MLTIHKTSEVNESFVNKVFEQFQCRNPENAEAMFQYCSKGPAQIDWKKNWIVSLHHSTAEQARGMSKCL